MGKPAASGSFESHLAAAQVPFFMIDLRNAPPDIAAWLDEPRQLYGPGPPNTYSIGQAFDVIVYTSRVRASPPCNQRFRSLPFGAPVCVDGTTVLAGRGAEGCAPAATMRRREVSRGPCRARTVRRVVGRRTMLNRTRHRHLRIGRTIVGVGRSLTPVDEPGLTVKPVCIY